MRVLASIRMFIGVAATIVGGVVAVTLTGDALAREAPSPDVLVAVVDGVADTPQGQLPHAFLNLETWPDSLSGTTTHGADGGAHPDWVSYGPRTNLSVPAHSLVTVTIKQYDTGERIANPFFAKARGTVDGTMTVDGVKVTEVDPETIGHTFTLHALVTNQDPLFVSVPLPAVDADAPNLDNGYPAPRVITFSFITKGPGEYVWQCEFPCGDGTYAKFGGAMSAMGYMAGTLTVKAPA